MILDSFVKFAVIAAFLSKIVVFLNGLTKRGTLFLADVCVVFL